MARQRRTDADRRARQCERIGRVLRVLQLVLSRGGPWDAEAIAGELEVSERTVYRDIQTLQVAGVPIYHDDRHGGYRVRPGFRLTCLEEPTDQEARSTGPRPGPDLGPEQLADAALRAARRVVSDTQELVDLLVRLQGTFGPRPDDSGGNRLRPRRSPP